jgi:predicted lipoprotein with Yx(FWY)xxD motif
MAGRGDQMDDASSCAGIRSQLGVYLTGAIAPADREAVVRHLAACADCRAELAGLAALPALLRRPPVQAAAQGFPEGDAGPDGAGPDGSGPDDAGSDEAGAYGDAVPRRLARRVRRQRRRRRWLLAAGAVVLAAVAGTGWALHLAGPFAPLNPPAPGSETRATELQTRIIDGVTVLTNAAGYTLYWFGPDSPTKSACLASCARRWPPVMGPATWSAGVAGTIGAIVRPGGILQATYDGHPLYTTTADTRPGQATGNGVWSHGGEWHEVTEPGRSG